MATSEFRNLFLGLAGILLSILGYFTPQYWVPLIALTALFLTFIFLSDINKSLVKQSEQLQRHEEKLKIHEQLALLRAEMDSIKEVILRMNKKGLSDSDFLNFLKVAVLAALLYVVYLAISSKLK